MKQIKVNLCLVVECFRWFIIIVTNICLKISKLYSTDKFRKYAVLLGLLFLKYFLVIHNVHLV